MIVLTRYLYIKEEVLTSLFISILNKDRQQALFWAYEYYFLALKKKHVIICIPFISNAFGLNTQDYKKHLQNGTVAVTKYPNILDTWY